VSLIGSVSQAVISQGTLSVSDNIYTTPIAAIGSVASATDLIIVPSGVNVQGIISSGHNYAAVLIQSLTATSPASYYLAQLGINLVYATNTRDLLYTGVHYVARDVLTPATISSSTTANVRTIRQLYRITDCNVYMLR